MPFSPLGSILSPCYSIHIIIVITHAHTDQFLAPNINTVFLKRVSPMFIYLCPPEKLVIEVEAAGRYSHIIWQKNGVPLTLQPQQFPNFNEILVFDVTTNDDLGLYEVSLRPRDSLNQRVQPSELDFSVVPPGTCIQSITVA